jgi:ketosteroid isomerase-like protein
MSAENVQLARRGYEAMLHNDLEAIAELLAPEVKWHGGDPNAEGACRNRGEALGFMRQARGRGRLGELVDVVDAGDRVVVILRRGRGAPNGGPGEIVANLTTIRDGQVVEMVHYADPADALSAAGVASKAG